jgi:hypothetical protein
MVKHYKLRMKLKVSRFSISLTPVLIHFCGAYFHRHGFRLNNMWVLLKVTHLSILVVNGFKLRPHIIIFKLLLNLLRNTMIRKNYNNNFHASDR